MTSRKRDPGESSWSQKLHTWMREKSNSRAYWILLASGIFFVLFIGMSNVGGLGLATHVAIPLSTNAEEARQAFGASDGGSYLQAALGLRDLGPWGIGGNEWIYGNWPPGMVVLNLLLLLIERTTGIPYVLLLVSAVSAIWTLILTRIAQVLERRKFGVGVAFLLVLSLSSVGHPILTVWSAYADGLAAGFLVLAAVELFHEGPLSRNHLASVYLRAAIFLSLAMHFRATYETVATFLVVVTAVLALAWFALSILLSRSFVFEWRNPVTSVFIVALASQVVSIPWRLIAGTFIRPGDFRWATTLDSMPAMRWFPTDLYSKEAGFLRVGHANFGCINDPVKCEEIRGIEQTSAAPYTGGGNFSQEQFQEELIQSFLNHPLTYFLERISMFFNGFLSTTGGELGDWRIFEALLLLVGFVVAMFFLVKNQEAGLAGLLMAFLSIGALSGVLLFFHMETRYLLPVKLLMMSVIFIFLSQRRKDTTVL